MIFLLPGVRPTVWGGVPRIWEKLKAAIVTKLNEAGGLRRLLFERAYAACELLKVYHLAAHDTRRAAVAAHEAARQLALYQKQAAKARNKRGW